MPGPVFETTCARCGTPMTCTPEGDCWCKDLPPRLPVPKGPAACFCPRCLEEAVPLPLPDIDAEAEVADLAAAVAEARSDDRSIPHAEVRTWLLEIAEAVVTAPPIPR